MTVLSEKEARLRQILKGLDRCVIAFSGGIDSTFLLYSANEVPGKRVTAVTMQTPYTLEREVRRAARTAADMGADHEIIRVPFPEKLRHNPPDHCYHCKRRLFSMMKDLAAERNIPHVLDGTNSDDLTQFRPGLKALKEMEIRSPLAEAGLTKTDIRQLARESGISEWDAPSDSCLLSRLPVNAPVDTDRFRDMEAAEDILIAAGFSEVRIRCHGDLARVEVPAHRIPELAAATRDIQLTDQLRALGFRHITLDLDGYRSGTMDETEKYKMRIVI